MTDYNHFIFSGTLVFPNIFLLRLLWVFCDAWFAQNIFLTELNSPFFAVHFSFAAIFQIFHFVRFRSYSKLKFPCGCSLQRRKSFVDIFFSFLRNKEANFRDHLKISSNFEQRERKYGPTQGGGGRVCGLKSVQKHFYCIFFCFYNNLFPLHFQFNALLKLQLNCEVTILPFSGQFFRMQWKSPELFVLKCSFNWWKPFCSIYSSLRESWR